MGRSRNGNGGPDLLPRRLHRGLQPCPTRHRSPRGGPASPAPFHPIGLQQLDQKKPFSSCAVTRKNEVIGWSIEVPEQGVRTTARGAGFGPSSVAEERQGLLREMSAAASVRIRRWRVEDLPGLVECHRAAYQDLPQSTLYDERIHRLQFEAFPEGQFLAEHRGKIIGYATSIIVQLDDRDDDDVYTYQEITGAGTFSTHDPSGDTLYGSDIAVHPDWRGRGIAGQLYARRKGLLKRHNLRRMLAYGRLPGYSQHVGEYTPEEYVAAVQAGEVKDSALNAHLKAGYRVRKVVLDLMADRTSLNYSTLLELRNPDYRPAKRRIASAPILRPVRKIRVCAAQYLMRPIKSFGEFERTVTFFADVADEYHCHFLLLPELFSVQLFQTMPRDWDYAKLMAELAKDSSRLTELYVQLAKTYSLYLIGGSHPVERNGKLYNVAPLITPSGHVYTQDKLHITPSERQYFKIRPGAGLKVFDTPLGRIGIQICYDIEFPEVSRLLTLAGAEVIFVPFSTDDSKAYHRVRYAGQARAVENYIFTVLSGNVGNLPSKSYLLNYGQTCILTPSDFPFPPRAIAAISDPNVETVAIGELDLSSLARHRDLGSVRPLYDRRADLYNLEARVPIEVIRVD